MAKPPEKKYLLITYSEKEELFNRLTHGMGALLSLAGLVALLLISGARGEPLRVVSSAVFGGSLLLFYLISTIYHSVRSPRIRYLFRIMDHASIFLVIAASYTPFTLVTLHGPWGWTLFGVVWGLALAGTLLKVFLTGRLRILGPILYLAMGWLVVIAIKPLLAVLPHQGFRWLLAGGIAYTVGILFYAIDRIPYNHAIWHLFVLTGSACHYFAVLWYVLPLN